MGRSGEFVDEHTLTTVISRMRGKLEGSHPYIKTVYGMGYLWNAKAGGVTAETGRKGKDGRNMRDKYRRGKCCRDRFYLKDAPSSGSGAEQ